MATNSNEETVKQTERAPAVKAPPQRVFLVPYPKIIFLYPSFFAALVVALILTFAGGEVGPENRVAVGCTLVFLGIMTINLVVMAFDFPRATSLTLFFLIAAVVLGAVVLFILKPNILPAIGEYLEHVRPVANATFYWLVSGLFAMLFLIVQGTVQFDYWEVRPNELLHHHGILSDMKRFSAPHLRIDKEINDVFEYMLLRSGRLILQPSGERRAIVLDNVPFISRKEEEITRMLSALQVQVRSEEH